VGGWDIAREWFGCLVLLGWFRVALRLAQDECVENTHLVPYLPVTPTFLVRFVILSGDSGVDGWDADDEVVRVDAELKFPK
jgi:hypothetical protein